MVQKAGFSRLRRLLGPKWVVPLGLCSVLLACSSEDRSPSVAMPVGQVFADQFVLTLPSLESTSTRSDRAELRRQIEQHGLTIEYEFSDRVGLADSLSVHGSLDALTRLQQRIPTLRIASSVVRVPLGSSCGNGVCEGDELATSRRGSLCSLDCGTLAHAAAARRTPQ
jgi:hypothetical protein